MRKRGSLVRSIADGTNSSRAVFGEAPWITTEDVNVEYFVFMCIDSNSISGGVFLIATLQAEMVVRTFELVEFHGTEVTPYPSTPWSSRGDGAIILRSLGHRVSSLIQVERRASARKGHTKRGKP